MEHSLHRTVSPGAHFLKSSCNSIRSGGLVSAIDGSSGFVELRTALYSNETAIVPSSFVRGRNEDFGKIASYRLCQWPIRLGSVNHYESHLQIRFLLIIT